jgi:hypothetical protein
MIIPIQLNIEAYAQESNHKITILMDSTELISKAFKENTTESITVNQDYNFGKPGFYNLVVNWNGDKECKEKYFKIKLCKINNEVINTNTINIEPFENEYIKELKSDPNKIDQYYDKLIRPGEKHGWYGVYKIKFCIGTKKDIKLLFRYSKSTFSVNSFKNKIYV